MPQCSASVAVVGAGDYIAIARRFARAGYHVFAGRRNGEKLAPLVGEIAARGGAAAERVLMRPASIAETYWQLHQQRRDARIHELDLRPSRETW
ncbi:MAG TPA: hypothetical protein VGM32_18500 [Rhodopila sp.]|jgi:NADP-dependent 3-hydroxy acid dehydrogenase YdfG